MEKQIRGRSPAIDDNQIGVVQERKDAIHFTRSINVDELGLRMKALQRRVLVVGIDCNVADR
jgi:hypothetical protein